MSYSSYNIQNSMLYINAQNKLTIIIFIGEKYRGAWTIVFSFAKYSYFANTCVKWK